VKRVAQELGGKSANILLPDVDIPMAVTKGVNSIMVNSGQSCTAPTRMFVPADRHDEATVRVDDARRLHPARLAISAGVQYPGPRAFTIARASFSGRPETICNPNLTA